jgi:hypothetical protein
VWIIATVGFGCPASFVLVVSLLLGIGCIVVLLVEAPLAVLKLKKKKDHEGDREVTSPAGLLTGPSNPIIPGADWLPLSSPLSPWWWWLFLSW